MKTGEIKKIFEKIATHVNSICVTKNSLWAGFSEEVLYSWDLNNLAPFK